MSLRVDVINTKGEKVGDLTLPKEVFGVIPNETVVSQYIRVYLTNQTQGTHKTKTKSEVSGGGRKPYAQKHTGRARRGSTRSPVVVGGGVSHGPLPFTKRLKVTKSQRKAALASVLSAKAISHDIMVLDNLGLTKFKTSAMRSVVLDIKAKEKNLFILDTKKSKDETKFALISSRNIPGVKVVGVKNVNTYDILNAQSVIFEKEAVGQLKEMFTA
ncbi:50S ribosomal protein L4 [candidate division WWE3 bacterium CG08_land_8_20_14_0_20_40_13]|uniref:Large ribosomal subunit protein uL4 n=1 Tax=candidate division WWE3 bacterium CG08_land_8_20_14_0_20_40_13 TaxID=1975084 RepID=A0A2H0XEH3_UNCKA|nr:MAG: 50S ribosomal protein L4 [candidate division WWE3 bacterium CG08_land_8_20_14_0_20_40_13]